MRGITFVTALLILVSSSQAQWPIGVATPVGGYAPALFTEPLWLGNPSYGYRIQAAPPGAGVLVVVAANRHDQFVAGLQVYLDLDPAQILATHSGVADASGTATLPIPLAGPDIPALAGLTAYTQAAVADPAAQGSYGATQGVLLEVELHPQCAIANFTTGLTLIDPVTGTTAAVTGIPAGVPATDAAFANGGRDLFVATSSGLFVVDTLAPTPSATALATGPWQSVAWDRVHRRLYALNGFAGILRVIDGNRASASFGSTITETPSASNSLAISADGPILALGTPQGLLERRNADPSSASYLQVIPTAASPVAFGFGISVGRVQLSPDGRVASILSTNLFSPPRAFLHRFDGGTGQWIDHDAATPGYQPLSSLTHPSLPATFSVLPVRNGSALILPGPTSVASVDANLHAPANVVVTTTPVAPTALGKAYDGLTPSGRFLVQHEYSPLNLPIAGVFSLVEVATGGVTPWVTLPNTPIPSVDSVAVWR